MGYSLVDQIAMLDVELDKLYEELRIRALYEDQVYGEGRRVYFSEKSALEYKIKNLQDKKIGLSIKKDKLNELRTRARRNDDQRFDDLKIIKAKKAELESKLAEYALALENRSENSSIILDKMKPAVKELESLRRKESQIMRRIKERSGQIRAKVKLAKALAPVEEVAAPKQNFEIDSTASGVMSNEDILAMMSAPEIETQPKSETEIQKLAREYLAIKDNKEININKIDSQFDFDMLKLPGSDSAFDFKIDREDTTSE